MGNQLGKGDARGGHWKSMNESVTPPFSSSKLRIKLPLINYK